VGKLVYRFSRLPFIIFVPVFSKETCIELLISPGKEIKMENLVSLVQI
jgi:hypothetical protein